MTVESECNAIRVKRSEIKSAILHNEPLDSKLHVIMVVSNPCEYKRRWHLAREFKARMFQNPHVDLYCVELAYGNQKFRITDPSNPKHLQLRTTHPIWHTENMVNVGVAKLLPPTWKAMAWVDADVEFENPAWALDTLKILNGCKDVVQLFSHCLDMDKNEDTMTVFHSFGYQYDNGREYFNAGTNYWHPGFAWACTRRAYESMGGLFQMGILGAGDRTMAFAFVGSDKSIIHVPSKAYQTAITDFCKRCVNLRLGYTPGIIRHYFHGSKKNRKYSERWKILITHAYDPSRHITLDSNGIIIPTPDCPPQLLKDIFQYFKERNEDE